MNKSVTLAKLVSPGFKSSCHFLYNGKVPIHMYLKNKLSRSFVKWFLFKFNFDGKIHEVKPLADIKIHFIELN